jgi:hypothetical protein
MNRREALGALAGAAVSFVLPAPRERIDLRRWCHRGEYGKYDMTLPWEVREWVYATDGPLLSFRFDGGEGLLAGMNDDDVKRRLVETPQ